MWWRWTCTRLKYISFHSFYVIVWQAVLNIVMNNVKFVWKIHLLFAVPCGVVRFTLYIHNMRTSLWNNEGVRCRLKTHIVVKSVGCRYIAFPFHVTSLRRLLCFVNVFNSLLNWQYHYWQAVVRILGQVAYIHFAVAVGDHTWCRINLLNWNIFRHGKYSPWHGQTHKSWV